MASHPPNNLHVLRGASISGDDCRLLVDSVVDYAIFMLDADGRVSTWNTGAEKIKGYAASEIIGQHLSVFYAAEDVAAGIPGQRLDAARKLGRAEDEGWHVRKDGTRFWASSVITALRDESGGLRGFGQVTRDLTARRAAEEDLRHAEERFHHLIDAVIDYAIFMLDAQGHVVTWNPGACRLKGYLIDEVVGQHFSIFYTPEDRAAGKPQRILDAVRESGRYEDESWRVRKDGSRFWANVVITSLRNEHGEVTGFAKVTRDLTDRRRAEDELRRSEERFRLLIENIGDYAIYMLDPTGRVTTWNPGAERMKGYAADEIIGQGFHCFFPEEDRRAGKPDRELEMARTLGRFEDEGWRERKDGTRFWANAILTALHDRDGALIGFAKITRDLTKRREAQELERRLLREEAAREAAEQAEQRLRDSEERYRALSQRLEIVIEGVADGITVQEASGRIIFANTAATRVCGFDSAAALMATPPEDILSRFEVFDEAGKVFDPEQMPGRRALAGESSSRALLCVRERSTRIIRWYTVHAAAARGTDRSPIAVNIWHDITQERRQELHSRYLAAATTALGGSLDANESLEGLATALVPALADWCVIHLRVDSALRVAAVAHVDPQKVAAAKEYQRRFPPQPTDPRGVWNVVRTGTPELYRDVPDALLAESVTDPERLAMLRAVGMKAAMLVPIQSRDEFVGVLSFVAAESDRGYDDADLALAEELGRRAGTAVEHARLYASAQAAAKTAEEASRAKDEFLAIVSHELRTPLNAIVGWAALLKERTTDPAFIKPIAVIYRNAEAQVKIIDDILDVSRVITGKFRLEPKPMDLVSVVREAIEAVRAPAEAKRLSLTFSPETVSCLIVADPVRMQQVIWNLLSNAVKFTERGGSISVATRQLGSSVSIRVEDTGKGIERDFLPFVFDRFKQADASITRRVGGLGLGLALVRHIVELHGGRVGAESDGPGRGARFTVTLPIRAVTTDEATPPLSHARPYSRAAEARDLTGVRVLVVDDEPDARELLEAVLGGAGARVESASSAAEGLDMLQRTRPDVLVSDLGMPDEDGFTFIRRVRALPPNGGSRVPAIALTALARDEDRTAALRAGYTTHIGKPVDAHALTAVIATLAAVNRPT